MCSYLGALETSLKAHGLLGDGRIGGRSFCKDRVDAVDRLKHVDHSSHMCRVSRRDNDLDLAHGQDGVVVLLVKQVVLVARVDQFDQLVHRRQRRVDLG